LIVFALVDRRHGQTVKTYTTRAEAEAERLEVVADQPELEGVIVVEEIELDAPSLN
jgi:hypothetical protein